MTQVLGCVPLAQSKSNCSCKQLSLDWCALRDVHMATWNEDGDTVRSFVNCFCYMYILFCTSWPQLMNLVISNLYYQPRNIHCNFVCDKKINTVCLSAILKQHVCPPIPQKYVRVKLPTWSTVAVHNSFHWKLLAKYATVGTVCASGTHPRCF